MKYRETIGMASVEYEGTPQEIHALLSLIEGESKVQKEIASCSDVNIQSGSAVICVSKEVAERIKDAENAISELKGATPDPTADVQNNTLGDFVMRGLAREVNRELPEMYVNTAPQKNNQSERPPLGVYPRFLHDEKRMEHIAEAIERFATVGKAVPAEWIEEYGELAEREQKRKGQG